MIPLLCDIFGCNKIDDTINNENDSEIDENIGTVSITTTTTTTITIISAIPPITAMVADVATRRRVVR